MTSNHEKLTIKDEKLTINDKPDISSSSFECRLNHCHCRVSDTKGATIVGVGIDELDI